MTALRTFVGRGMQDAESRLARLTTPVDDPDDVAVSVVETSGTFRLLASTVDWVERAAHGSTIVAWCRRLDSRRRAAGAMAQRRLVGVILLVAALVHVLLASTLGATPGWLWLVVPGVALTTGLLLMAASSVPEHTRTEL